MTMLHQCSGCENVCEIGYQYCDECELQIEQDDMIDALDDYEPTEEELQAFLGLVTRVHDKLKGNSK